MRVSIKQNVAVLNVGDVEVVATHMGACRTGPMVRLSYYSLGREYLPSESMDASAPLTAKSGNGRMWLSPATQRCVGQFTSSLGC